MTGEVSPAGRPGEVVPQTELRASHTDRDRVVEMLRVAAGDGRLTAEELDERLEAALTARTYSELAVLTTDLPAAPAGASASLATPEAKDLVKIDCGSGSAKRDGHWVVPQRIDVRVTSGSVKLDLTKAVISYPVLTLDADVKSGSLTLVTRPGVIVDADDVTVRSGSVKVKTHRGRDAAAAPVLRVQVAGKVTSGSLTARPPRRTLWQWLMRRPYVYS
jgi:hypothetical protein